MTETLGQTFSDAIETSGLLNWRDPSLKDARDMPVKTFVTFSEFLNENRPHLMKRKSFDAWTQFLSKNLKSVPEKLHRPCLSFIIKIGTILELKQTKELYTAIAKTFQDKQDTFREIAMLVSKHFSFTRTIRDASFVLEVTAKDTSKLSGWYLRIVDYVKETGGLKVVGKQLTNKEWLVKELNARYGLILEEMNAKKLTNFTQALVKAGYLIKQARENPK